MAYIILRGDGIVMFYGENYTIATDELNPSKQVYIINGYRFSSDFELKEIKNTNIPLDINKGVYKYKNGEFVKIESI